MLDLGFQKFGKRKKLEEGGKGEIIILNQIDAN